MAIHDRDYMKTAPASYTSRPVRHRKPYGKIVAITLICSISALGYIYSTEIKDFAAPYILRPLFNEYEKRGLPIPQIENANTRKAKEIAVAELEKYWKSSNGSWFTYYKGALNHQELPVLVQVTGLYQRVQEEPLTEEDHANGIKWQGFVYFDASMHRFWTHYGNADIPRASHDPTATKWSEWISGSAIGSGGFNPLLPSAGIINSKGDWQLVFFGKHVNGIYVPEIPWQLPDKIPPQ